MRCACVRVCDQIAGDYYKTTMTFHSSSSSSLVALLALAALASLAPVAVQGALPAPWNFYHTTEEILSEFARMASENPNLMKWQPVRTEW